MKKSTEEGFLGSYHFGIFTVKNTMVSKNESGIINKIAGMGIMETNTENWRIILEIWVQGQGNNFGDFGFRFRGSFGQSGRT